ncbi:PHP domain-containing protein [Gracilibacillus oryzae]|uniref:PHP domain-containing protein n=1 Tax=Gracilibacillus oryzae TaxID=1672701 RepID=A0A7C8KUV6_9BACI|nr:PHP domain-containing protein [Gracilibacillus oryzae]KAB8137766.1 PHP domain-containing protein [Gracilibacillus oryzae]
MKADLHVHSKYSDGFDTIEAVLQQAKQQQISSISFVDHDTAAGQEEAIRIGQHYNINVIPGIEISAYDFKRNRKVHILGYQYDLDAKNIKALCDPLLIRRHHHSLWQIEQIQLAGYDISLEKISASIVPGSAIYKQHIMRQLTASSYESENYQNLYQSLFKQNGVASGDIEYVDVFKAVHAIKQDNGIAVIAHPGQLDSYDLIPELAEAGLDGVERHHPDHTREDHLLIDSLAEKYNLILTGGTDYHGLFGAAITIGEVNSPPNQLINK